MNVALIVHRKKFPAITRPFRVPLVPLLPLLGIGANLYLLSLIFKHTEPVIMAGVWMVLGMLGFLAWKGSQTEEEALPGVPSRVAESSPEAPESRFRVLVPIANPDNVAQLMELAAAIAADNSGEIVALRVVQVPEQLPPSREASYVERERRILEHAHAQARTHGVHLTSVIRVGYNTARAILETSRERECDLILLGWKGYTTTAKRILGEVVDDVVTHARTDLMMVKMVGEVSLKKVLLSTTGGDNARLAEKYAGSLVRSQNGVVTVCGVVGQGASRENEEMVSRWLEEAAARLAEGNGLNIESKLVRHRSVSVGIIREAENHDAVVLGAARDSFYKRVLFGNIPESVAKHTDKTVIVFKKYSPVKALFGRVMED